MRPYVGITGFVRREEIEAARRVFNLDTPRQLMVGILASYKSLRKEPMNEYWAQQTPPLYRIPEMLYADPKILNLIHYSADDDKSEFLLNDMFLIVDKLNSNFHGFQLNLTWPNPDFLYDYHKHSDYRHKIVLQIGKAAIKAAGSTGKGIVERLSAYQEVICGILLDLSGGNGVPLDPKHALRMLRAVAKAYPKLRLGTAGGLGPDSMHLIEPIAKEFPSLNIDAQRNLRDEQNRLSHKAVCEYFSQAKKILAM